MSDSGRAWVRKAATVILLLSGMSDAPTAAAARPPQGLPREPEVQGYRQAGPLFYQAALRVKAFGYDDNVFLDRDHPQGGIVGTLGPELLGVVRLGPQVWVSLHGGVDFTGYSRQPSIDHFDNQRGSQLTLWAGDLRFMAGYDDERALRRPSSEIDARVRIDRSIGRLAALYEITTASTIEVVLGRTKERYERADGFDYEAALGHTDASLAIIGRHRLRPSTWAVVDLSDGRRAGREPRSARDLRQRQILAGFDFEPGAPIQGSVRLGLASIATPRRPSGKSHEYHEYQGASGSGDLSVRVTSRSQVRALFRRDFTPSGYLDDVYFRNDTAEVSLLRELSSRVAGEAGHSRGWNVYPDSDLDPFSRRDRIAESFVGARVRLGSQAVLGIRVGRWSRDSNAKGQDRDRFAIDQSITIPL